MLMRWMVLLVLVSCSSEHRVDSTRSALVTCASYEATADVTIYLGSPTWADNTSDLRVGPSSGNNARALVKWEPTFPPGTVVVSATASFYPGSSPGTVDIHRATAAWTEATHWNAFAGAFDSTPSASFTWLFPFIVDDVDVTTLVEGWRAGTWANHGIVMTHATLRKNFSSSESGSTWRRPVLTVCTDTVAAPVDARPPDAEIADAALPDAEVPDAPMSPIIDASLPDSAAEAPDGGALDTTVTIGNLGDWGVIGAPLTTTSDRIKGWNPDWIVTNGDNVYSESTTAFDDIDGTTFGGAWRAKLLMAIGNHDRCRSSSGTCTGTDFRLPEYLAFVDHPLESGNERYYRKSLDATGLVDLFVVNTESDPDGISATSVQGQWFEDELAASDACFKVMVMHQRAFGSQLANGAEPVWNKNLRWPFESWGVNLLIHGDTHGYQRVEVGGLTVVTNGVGGARLDQAFGDWKPLHSFWSNPSWWSGPMPVVAYQYDAENWGVARIVAERSGSSGTLTIEFWPNGATTYADRRVISKTCP